jgi:hypothetical protein
MYSGKIAVPPGGGGIVSIIIIMKIMNKVKVASDLVTDDII